ncbi:uncharacterized protein CIMG_13488 [Coccidioides immitis RS]|uniref:Uncharacterized protein n=1 Tax=Coccidioides immitis (strain RS) TaxID=246410 RepID=J3K0B0_COCIM|nr:uncharacterized protein CIMG_13488 [Coccidioides immitis RS]EAS27264.3 hypothetical protein CIMG_13488 [Coccidioides immitis RS]
MGCVKSFPCAHPFHTAGEEQHKAALKEWALKKSNWHKANKDVDLTNFNQENLHPCPPVQNWKASTHMCHQENPPLPELYQANLAGGPVPVIGHEYHWQHTAIESLQKTAEAILYALFEYSVMAMAHYKHITVNTNNMKLVLGIGAKIRSNYFSLIDAPDHSASAATTHCLHAAPTLPTTAATTPPPLPPPTTASLPPPSTIRVSTCQMAGIRAPVWFTKPVLEEQEEEKKEEEEGEKKNDNDDEDDDNDD